MNILNKIVNKFTFLAIALFAATLTLTGGTASARTQYQDGGTGTSTTPVLNEFYNVPNGVGDEADFVRVKPKAGGNGDYVDALSAACNNGDAFTVRTYVHNGASPDHNNNGSGPAVAKNVTMALQAELNAPKTGFQFSSTIASSNMAGATDTATLNCNGKTVKLSLVPSSVQIYSRSLGFNGLADGVVNGAPFRIGSQVLGSGDVWACWNDRVTVTYEVKVEEEKEPPVEVPTDAICKLDGGITVVDAKKRTIKITVKPELTNATVVSYEINWGDGNKSNEQTATHSYAKDGRYDIQISVVVKLNDGTLKTVTGSDAGSDCAQTIEFKGDKPPVVIPPTTPPTTPPVTMIPAAGTGGILGVFAAVSSIGAVLHRIVLARKNA